LLPIATIYADQRVAYSNPKLFGGQGVVPAFISGPDEPLVVEFFISTDGGRSWSLAAELKTSSDGAALPVWIATSTSWLLQTEDSLLATADGLSFSPVAASGLGASLAVEFASDGPVFWAIVSSSDCPNGKLTCKTTHQLKRSVDGGATWAILQP
jgi:hypothetical protein